MIKEGREREKLQLTDSGVPAAAVALVESTMNTSRIVLVSGALLLLQTGRNMRTIWRGNDQRISMNDLLLGPEFQTIDEIIVQNNMN